MTDKTTIEKAKKALRIADEFCGNHTAEECPDSVHIPIREALAALEAEKPAEDAEEVAISIANLFSTYTLRNDKHLPASVEAAHLLMNFAESYHASRCKEESAAILAASDRLGAALDESDKV